MNASPPPFHVEHLSVSYNGSAPALDNVTFSAQAGLLTAIIGPNGAGKSSLLKAATGLISPQNGVAEFFGKSFDQARGRIAHMPQRQEIDWTFPVNCLDVVLMGVPSYLQGFVPWVSSAEKDKAMNALEAVQMQEYAKTSIGALSGGQQQRIFLARALAQAADLYMMDEPFAGIDFKAQEIITNVLKDLKSQGKTVMVVHHDLEHVKEHFDEVLLLNKAVIAAGKTQDVLTQDHLSHAYGLTLSQGLAPA